MDNVVTDTIKTNKDQHNDAIYNEPTFDTKFFNLYSGTKEPIQVVTVSLQGCNKHRAKTVSGITCLWDSRDTNRMIKIRHTKYYERKMRSKKLEYSMAIGLYCMAHDVKLPFCMP